MNTPTHIVSGICLAQIICCRWGTGSALRRGLTGFACFTVGMFLHLCLDHMPHYAWIVYLPGFEKLPFHWLMKEGLATLIVATPCMFIARKNWPYAILGVVGAIYPDMEKVAAIDFHAPERFIIFKSHSLQLSSHDGGISHGLLIATELGLIAGMMLWIYASARASRGGKGDARSYLPSK